MRWAAMRRERVLAEIAIRLYQADNRRLSARTRSSVRCRVKPASRQRVMAP